MFEFHNNSMTQTGASCAALLTDVDHPDVGTYWQPMPELDVNQNLAELRRVLPWVWGLHVFHWGPTHMDRHALALGEAEWAQYLATVSARHGTFNALLEFVNYECLIPNGFIYKTINNWRGINSNCLNRILSIN